MASSSSTVFIALQCFHCSTMQVKQKKKSSNKWNCAVCNQKQSVRKVFAQGYKAKDIRTFVQSFNMSRKSLDDDQQWLQAGTLNHAPEYADGESEFPNDLNNNNKCTDWTVYLDNDDCRATERAEQEHHEDDFELLVVTELPKNMLKKRKLVDNSNSRSARHFKSPLFRNSQDVGEPVKDQGRITVLTESNSERNNIVTTANQRTQKCKQTINSSASKWNDYLTDDNLEFGFKRGFNSKDTSSSWNNDILEAITCEQRVEDDIHPDFM
ncbi:uncharacterized protein LOC123905487 [Trifolium pratense]|uniref:uncharacterized protein LOC123905487 n=1 Tax=Trifolium pratense TaxID=57577 RepID=UPI001E695ACE|nr:uncharacterized protein LOC123905487 [Trifolium pratense]